MSNPNETKIVTVDDGNGPVKAVKDAAGRLLSKEHVKALRDKQQAELDQVTQVRDKLSANDAATKTDIVGQFGPAGRADDHDGPAEVSDAGHAGQVGRR